MFVPPPEYELPYLGFKLNITIVVLLCNTTTKNHYVTLNRLYLNVGLSNVSLIHVFYFPFWN